LGPDLIEKGLFRDKRIGVVQKVGYGGEAAFAVVNLIVECIVEVEYNGVYHFSDPRYNNRYQNQKFYVETLVWRR